MNKKLFPVLLRQFNRTRYRSEKSLIEDIKYNPSGDNELKRIFQKHISLIRSYKQLLEVLDYNFTQVNQNEIIKKLQKEFDDRAKYGFNCSNELFIKFFAKVFEKNFWSKEFDDWLKVYLEQNVKKMSQSYSQQMKKALQNCNKNEEYTQILDDHVKQIESLKQLI
ncbi:unnamed protein product (macronuclear) [Paramecium tetraurelia]|uniref:Uncharacterized protein n=1 Tax=Paramecium tetraurelia TaxID=5888 RepID=A0EAR6_PARTE|nr:uncharacterized protein GSPATT00025117001 [Paramecium tetraurelia]CAK92383.1 unnamed protein product [Paramecium tetraurelia]|eukprot:XP_001459780.1 hypothetical protein (macronuclear) [Paramecium tetraurelia strain d4-2]